MKKTLLLLAFIGLFGCAKAPDQKILLNAAEVVPAPSAQLDSKTMYIDGNEEMLNLLAIKHEIRIEAAEEIVKIYYDDNDLVLRVLKDQKFMQEMLDRSAGKQPNEIKKSDVRETIRKIAAKTLLPEQKIACFILDFKYFNRNNE